MLTYYYAKFIIYGDIGTSIYNIDRANKSVERIEVKAQHKTEHMLCATFIFVIIETYAVCIFYIINEGLRSHKHILSNLSFRFNVFVKYCEYRLLETLACLPLRKPAWAASSCQWYV